MRRMRVVDRWWEDKSEELEQMEYLVGLKLFSKTVDEETGEPFYSITPQGLVVLYNEEHKN
jgi:hypothetical protein